MMVVLLGAAFFQYYVVCLSIVIINVKLSWDMMLFCCLECRARVAGALNWMFVADAINRPCQQQWLTDSSGWIASPVYTGCTTESCRDCQSVICIPEQRPVQLRFRTVSSSLSGLDDYIDIRDGRTSSDRLIKRLYGGELPVLPLESSENCVFISFHGRSTNHARLVFNATYQEKGLDWQDAEIILLVIISWCLWFRVSFPCRYQVALVVIIIMQR